MVAGPGGREHDATMREPVIRYVECSVPEHMTISDYRRSRPRCAPRRGLRRFLRRPRGV